jgi:hypothetical protein
MRWWKLTLRSIVVASVVGLAAPALWFIIAGETHRTPVVAKAIFEKMTQAEIEEWKRENSRHVGFWEHLKSTPNFIALFWQEYLVWSGAVFLLVLVVNSAFLAGRRDEP